MPTFGKTLLTAHKTQMLERKNRCTTRDEIRKCRIRMYDAAMYGGWKECGKQRMDNKAKVRTMKRKDGTLWSFSLAGTPYLCRLSENVGNLPDCKISNLHTIMTERTSVTEWLQQAVFLLLVAPPDDRADGLRGRTPPRHRLWFQSHQRHFASRTPLSDSEEGGALQPVWMPRR